VADNPVLDNGVLTDITIAADDLAGVGQAQYIKLMDGTLDSSAKIAGDATNGLDVDVTRLPVLPAGDNVMGRVKISDGTTVATVRDLPANDGLNVAIVDGAGNQVTSFGGSGGTSSTDNSAFTAGTTPDTPMAGFYQSTPSAVTDGRSAAIGIDANRRVKVTVDASTIDVAHDAADSGNPVKVGTKAANALPTAVANNDRANAISDLFGRLLVTDIDPAMQVHKNANITSTQTGGVLWDPTAGKRIAITSVVLGSYATTAGRVILWFGDNADTVYTAGTDQLLFAASFAPSTTSKPGIVFTPHTPVFSTTADRELHITTDAAISLDLAIEGYEF